MRVPRVVRNTAGAKCALLCVSSFALGADAPSASDALAQSAILRHLVDSGAGTIVGAHYELESGRVTFSQPIGASSGAHTTSPEPRR